MACYKMDGRFLLEEGGWEKDSDNSVYLGIKGKVKECCDHAAGKCLWGDVHLIIWALQEGKQECINDLILKLDKFMLKAWCVPETYF